MLEFLYYSLIHFHACFINFIQKIVYRKFLIWRFVSIRGTQKTRSLARGRYPTPSKDEKGPGKGVRPLINVMKWSPLFSSFEKTSLIDCWNENFLDTIPFTYFFPQCSVLKTMKIHVLWNTLKKKYGLFLL